MQKRLCSLVLGLGVVAVGIFAMGIAMAMAGTMMTVTVVVMNAFHGLQLAVRLFFTGVKGKSGNREHKQTEAFHRPRELNEPGLPCASLKKVQFRKSLRFALDSP